MLSNDEKDTIEYISIASACIGMIGALFMIVMILGFKNNRSHFSFRIVLYLAISDAGSCLIILTGPGDSDNSFCQFQGVMRSFFGLASVLWVDVIAWVPYKLMISLREQVKFSELRIICVVFGYCLFISLLPLSTDSYKISATGYCWLSEQTDRTVAIVWQMIQFYIPLWLSFVFSSWAYYQAYRRTKFILDSVDSIDEAKKSQAIRNLSRLRLYPFVLVVAYFFGTINRIYLFANSGNPNVALACLHNLFANMLGMFNCIVYGLNSQVKRNLQKCLPCLKKDELLREESEVSS